MRLTGTALVSVLFVLAIGFPVVLAVTWRVGRTRAWRIVFRVLGVLVAQALAIAAAGVAANNQYGFYNTWADLTGTEQHAAQAPVSNSLVPTDGSLGRVLSMTVVPSSSRHAAGVTDPMRVLAWVPPQYDEPQYRSTRFPVAMMLPGQPGTPQGVFNQFQFGRLASAAIAQHQVKPFVAVFPPIMIAPPRDTECTDVPGGPQAESWLYRDVRTSVLQHLRVTPDGRQWSAMGWSTGGFCAAKLLLRHPTMFHAAVSFGAYFDAETDHTTGNLYGGSQQVRNENSPMWLLQHRATGPTRLLIIVSRDDRDSWSGKHYADSAQMIAATRGAPGVATMVLPQGGHNYHVYLPTMTQSLVWLGHNAAL